jgi:PAS domain S-box-containing protein
MAASISSRRSSKRPPVSRRGSLLGRRLAELAAANAGSAVQDEQRAAIAAEKPFRDLFFRLERADGAGPWIEIVGTTIFDAGGFCGYHGIGKTVVEGDLELQRYRQLFEVASDWFWETDAENRVTYVSPNIESVLGLPPSAYRGKRLADTKGVTIDPEAGKASLAAIKARQPYQNFIYSRKLPDGRTVWINSSGAPFHARDGAFLGYRGIARDVTAQVEAEGKSRESEQRFRELFEIYSDYYWERDAQHRLTFVSPESIHDELYSVPAVQLYGKRISEFLNVSIDPGMGRKALKAHKARQPIRDLVISVKNTSNGKKRWISISSAPVFDAQGQYLGDRGIGVEITERIEAEATARLAQRQLHDAVTHVSQPFAVFDTEQHAVAFNVSIR